MTTIKLRRDTASNWSTVNPILAEGEVGLELDTGKSKIGDGSTAWNSLGYSAYTINEIDTLLDNKQDVLTAGDGINIRTVYSGEITNSYSYRDSSHTDWTSLTDVEAQSLSLSSYKIGRSIESIDGTKDFQFTCILPITTIYVGFTFNPSVRNNYYIPYIGFFAIKRTSSSGTDVGFYTSKSTASWSWNTRGTANNISLTTTQMYIKLVKSNTNFYWYYRTSESDEWTNIMGDGNYMTATNNTSSSSGSNVYFPYTTSSNVPVYFGSNDTISATVDMTTTKVVYTPIPDPQEVISVDDTIQRSLGYTPVNKAGDTMNTYLGINTTSADSNIIRLKNSNSVLANVASSNIFTRIDFRDTNDASLGGVLLRDTTTERELRLRINSYSGGNQSLVVGYDTNNKAYALAPSSDIANSIVTTVSKSKSQNGYYKLGNGLIVQWGFISQVSAGTGSILFSTAFSSSTSYSITSGLASPSASIYFSNASTTGIDYTTSGTKKDYYWVAVGY